MRDKLERLYRVFDRKDRVGIFIIPDPDSIACAMAMQALIRHHVTDCETVHLTDIHRSDNKTMIRLLKISHIPFRHINPDQYTKLVMVDGQPDHNPLCRDLRFDVVIDHHPNALSRPVAFSDIRPEYGAAASIMTEYLLHAGIRITPRLATALYYAIKTDTDMFRRIDSRVHKDVAIICHLMTKIKIETLRIIEGSEIPRKALRHFSSALNEVYFCKSLAYTYLGEIQSDEICTIMADFLLRVKGTHWSIVSASFNCNLILVMRSWKERRDVGKIASRIFRPQGAGGGHIFAARAEIPLKDVPADVLSRPESLQNYILDNVGFCGRNHRNQVRPQPRS